MPLLQIEQDNPELIAQVRNQIEQMVERIHNLPSTVIVVVAEEYVRG